MKVQIIRGLALAALLLCLTGCEQDAQSQSTASALPQTESSAAEKADPALQQQSYPFDVLTGLPHTSDVENDRRIAAVMVNNYTECRPQRGLSSAKILFEIKTEGGATWFMGLYSSLEDIPTVGPLRGGRDQFFRMVLPWQPLYVHIGQSDVQGDYIRNYQYDEWNVEGWYDAFWWRNTERRNLAGEPVDLEHTAYTDAAHLMQYVQERQVDDTRIYNSPFLISHPKNRMVPECKIRRSR